jgi:hypothetical protein
VALAWLVVKKQKFVDGPPARAKTILFSLEMVPAVAAQTFPDSPCAFAGLVPQ